MKLGRLSARLDASITVPLEEPAKREAALVRPPSFAELEKVMVDSSMTAAAYHDAIARTFASLRAAAELPAASFVDREARVKALMAESYASGPYAGAFVREADLGATTPYARTLNETRADLGLEPTEGGEMLVPLGGDGRPSVTILGPDGYSRTLDVPSPEHEEFLANVRLARQAESLATDDDDDVLL